MTNLDSMDEIIEKAFALAFFIQGNRVQALSVVMEALSKLEVAAAAQEKRLYYTPARRSLWTRAQPQNHRTKISLSDLHLLQRLIYVESEPHEKEREQQMNDLTEEELLIHFIKYLIRISIRRNSFYVTLGVSRLLHNYSTAETMEIYNVVVQDPERVKDDCYYRSRKARMLQEIKGRFGEFITVCRGARGEERFQAREAPGPLLELAAECLNRFSPWQTCCSVPASFDPTAEEIPALSSYNHSDEDQVEINRIHAVVHTDCYRLITRTLKLEPPAERLSIPQFFIPKGRNNMNGNDKLSRRTPPPLDRDEIEMLKRGLAEKSARRRATHASLLSVWVDGAERARLDLLRSRSLRLEVEDSAELLEVRALENGEAVLLATHLLGESAGGRSHSVGSEILLEGGQKLSFEFSPELSGSGDSARRVLTVSYRETALLQAVSLSSRRLLRGLSEANNIRGWREHALVKPAPASLLLLLAFASAVVLFALRANRIPAPTAEVAANKQPTLLKQAESINVPATSNVAVYNGGAPSESPGSNQLSRTRASASKPGAKKLYAREGNQDTAPSSLAVVGNPKRKTWPNQPEEDAGRGSSADSEAGNQAPAESTRAESDVTRSANTSATTTRLSKVRKVFLDISGDAALSAQASRMLARSLGEGRRLSATESKDDADAAIKLFVTDNQSAGKSGATEARALQPDLNSRVVTAFVRLVNEDGEVIWPIKSNGRRYTGTIKEVTRKIARDLARDIYRYEDQK